MTTQTIAPSEEQSVYADLLFYGCWTALLIMIVTYLLYVLGVIAPHVPLAKMPDYWSQPVSVFLAEASVPTGWGWTSLLGRGDFLNFPGVALLAGLSIICYLRVLPMFLRKKEQLMFVIGLLEVLVLLFAASGIVGSGAH